HPTPDFSVRIWDVATGKQLLRILSPDHRQTIQSVAFSRDGRIVAAGFSFGGFALWDSSSGQLLQHIGLYDSPEYSYIAFSPDGVTMATVGTGRRVPRFKDVPPGQVDHLLPSVIRIREVATGKELRPLAGHKGWVTAIAFDATGRSLASTGVDGTFRIWDVPTGKERLHIQGAGIKAGGLQYVNWSADGKLLAGMGGGVIQVWDAATGKGLSGVKGGGMGFAMSPSGDRLAWGSWETIHLMEPRTGKSLFRHAGHAGAIRQAAFSPDGRAVLTLGVD